MSTFYGRYFVSHLGVIYDLDGRRTRTSRVGSLDILYLKY